MNYLQKLNLLRQFRRRWEPVSLQELAFAELVMQAAEDDARGGEQKKKSYRMRRLSQVSSKDVPSVLQNYVRNPVASDPDAEFDENV